VAPRWLPAYIGMGSNQDSPKLQIGAAVEALKELRASRLMRLSSLYQTAPMGPVDQPDFLNAVAVLLTQLDAADLLRELQRIEDAQGRDRSVERWGPRCLDLDLLAFAGRRIDEAEITVPHPGIAERNFVLLPLRELAPHVTIPGLATVAKLAARFDDDSSVVRVGTLEI